MTIPRQGCIAILASALLTIITHPVLADVIDGHWCFPDGKRMSIQGPIIVTPAGTQTQGDYSRHFFRYVIPPTDPDPGQTVALTLVNEDTVYLRTGNSPSYSSDGPVQVWHRCGPPTS